MLKRVTYDTFSGQLLEGEDMCLHRYCDIMICDIGLTRVLFNLSNQPKIWYGNGRYEINNTRGQIIFFFKL